MLNENADECRSAYPSMWSKYSTKTFFFFFLIFLSEIHTEMVVGYVLSYASNYSYIMAT